MASYVAFLRGINVGGHRVKMDRLRGLFEELDFRDVSTFIASGNVMFSTESEDLDAMRDMIEHHLARELGYDVATFLRSPMRLAAIASANPSKDPADDSSASSCFVIFLHHPAAEPLRAALSSLESEVDAFEFSGTEVLWRTRGKLSDSPLFGGGLDRAFRTIPTTMRNVNTIRRIVAKTGIADADA